MGTNQQKEISLSPSWKTHLKEEFEKDYMKALKLFLINESNAGKIIFPHGKNIFQAFDQTPFEKVKVVIIGQDPYHGDGQAHGLSFSVQRGIPQPPSLVNIFKELKKDLGISPPNHGELSSWATEGVLLLNNVLTVERGKAASHHNIGWELFTDKIIEILDNKKENLVFILWGTPAQKKAAKVDTSKHLIIKSVHPSPLSSYRGFFGSRPFSQANSYLKSHGIKEINWQLPE